jgi:hypothetical protein
VTEASGVTNPETAVTRRLSIIRMVVAAYRDLWHVVLTLRTLVICALLILLAFKVAEDLVPWRTWSRPVVGDLLGFVHGAVQSFLLTPFMIALHRFIVLDEVTSGYALDPSRPNVMLFFKWLVVLSAIGSLAFWAYALLTALDVPIAGAGVSALVILAAAAFIFIRLAILFPAIAVNAPGAQAANAWSDTRGHAVRIFMIFALALLAPLPIVLATTWMLGPEAHIPGTPVAIASLFVSAIMHAVTLTLSVAIASRVFQIVGDRVVRPA